MELDVRGLEGKATNVLKVASMVSFVKETALDGVSVGPRSSGDCYIVKVLYFGTRRNNSKTFSEVLCSKSGISQ